MRSPVNPATVVAFKAPARCNRAQPERLSRPDKPRLRTSEPDLFAKPWSILIVGLDDRDRPHASRFPAADCRAVGKAAAMMGMATVAVQSPALAELAAKLPDGKLFASGKAFVPFVGQDLYRRLEAYLPVGARGRAGRPKAGSGRATGNDAGEAEKDAGGKSGAKDDAGNAASEQNKYADAKATKTPRSGKYPEDWDKIVAGHIVLASAERDDGWWTAHVREVREDGVYLLEWEEWKGFAKFVCRREQIALLHPDYDGK